MPRAKKPDIEESEEAIEEVEPLEEEPEEAVVEAAVRSEPKSEPEPKKPRQRNTPKVLGESDGEGGVDDTAAAKSSRDERHHDEPEPTPKATPRRLTGAELRPRTGGMTILTS